MRFVKARTAVVAATATVAVAAVAFGAGGGGAGVSPTPFGTPTPGNPNPSRHITAVRGDRMWDWTQQTRSEVVARHGMVATSQPLAAQAGLQTLRDGGNAAATWAAPRVMLDAGRARGAVAERSSGSTWTR